MQHPVPPPEKAPHPDTDRLLAEAIVLHQRDAWEEAAVAYARVLDAAPDHAEALQLLALVQKRLGNMAGAVELLHHSLRVRPEQGHVWFNLGNSYADMQQFDAAYEAYKQAMLRDPKNPAIHIHFSAVCRQRRSFREAEAALQVALRLVPEDASAWQALGLTLKAQGRYPAALKAYARALELDAANPVLHANVAGLFLLLGRRGEAAQAYGEALRLKPDFTAVHRQMAQLHVYASAADPHIAQMEELLRARTTEEKDKTALLFALAKAYGEAGVAGKSRELLQKANRQKRAEYADYDVEASERWFRDIAAAYPPETIRRQAGEGREDDAPVFLVGMPHAGTEELARYLSRHPAVHHAGELDELRMLVHRVWPRWYGGVYPQGAQGFSASHGLQLSGEYLRLLEQYRPSAEVERILDSMPGNFRFIGLIHALLPRAKIIHCRREPVANCLAIYRDLLPGQHPYAYDLRELGRYHRAYQRLMAHWHAVLPPGVLCDVTYEELMEKPEDTLRRLLDFCHVSWNDACRADHEAKQEAVPLTRQDMERLKPLLDALES